MRYDAMMKGSGQFEVRGYSLAISSAAMASSSTWNRKGLHGQNGWCLHPHLGEIRASFVIRTGMDTFVVM